MLPTVTTPQLRMMFGLARKLGLDGDGLHDLVAARVGKESLRELTRAEARETIEHLLGCGRARKRRREKLPANVIALPSRKQLELVGVLAVRLGWGDSPERLTGLCRRVTGHDFPRTSKEVQALIEALKSMSERACKRVAQAPNT